MRKVSSHALGCKVNQYESEAIAQMFLEKGYEVVDIEESADVYVINTCTVTNLGDKKSRQLIRRVKRHNPKSIVVVVGCYAQTSPAEISNIPGVNLIIGTKGRSKIVDLVENYNEKDGMINLVGEMKNEKDFENLSIAKLLNRTRAYLKIQDGCSQFCSYCIIPYARGPIRSRDPEEVMKEVIRLRDNGFLEIVLTGIHVASYGKDRTDISLLSLLEQVSKVEGIERIRLSSIEPTLITEEFLSALSRLPKVCHHFHLSLQSGSDKTLKAMNRKYTTSLYRQAVRQIRSIMPDCALTTDIIVGFPGETDEDFIESYHFADEIGFTKIHVFPYSPKKGTPAADRADQIPNQIKAKRAKLLSALSAKHVSVFLESQLGQRSEVLFENKNGENIYEGHTSNYIKVQVESALDLKNQLRFVKLLKADGEIVLGELIQ